MLLNPFHCLKTHSFPIVKKRFHPPKKVPTLKRLSSQISFSARTCI
jgi:hypothetical protein